jgi:hypothetical protein
MEATKKSVWNYLFRPSLYIAGGKSLLLGIIVMLILTFLGYGCFIAFDGVIDAHYLPLDKPIPLLHHVYCVFGSWAVSVLVFYITALLVSKVKTRFIDIAGTLAVAKTPYILAAVIGLIPGAHLNFGVKYDALTMQDMLAILQDNIIMVIFMSLIGIILLIWVIVLMYNAYSVSANIKGNKGILSFIVAVLVSEILSKIMLFFIL